MATKWLPHQEILEKIMTKKPIKIFAGTFSHRIFASSSYRALPNGAFVANSKDDVTEDFRHVLKGMTLAEIKAFRAQAHPHEADDGMPTERDLAWDVGRV